MFIGICCVVAMGANNISLFFSLRFIIFSTLFIALLWCVLRILVLILFVLVFSLVAYLLRGARLGALEFHYFLVFVLAFEIYFVFL